MRNFFTSPRRRGEVDFRAQRESRVRGHFDAEFLSRVPLTRLAALRLATLSPQAGKGENKEEKTHA